MLLSVNQGEAREIDIDMADQRVSARTRKTRQASGQRTEKVGPASDIAFTEVSVRPVGSSEHHNMMPVEVDGQNISTPSRGPNHRSHRINYQAHVDEGGYNAGPRSLAL
jgi:hypothetical protein